MTSSRHIPGLRMLAQRRLDEFDFVGLTERFEDTVRLFCKRFATCTAPAHANRVEHIFRLSPNQSALLGVHMDADVMLYAHAERLFNNATTATLGH